MAKGKKICPYLKTPRVTRSKYIYLFIVCSVKDVNAQEYLHHVLFGFSFWCLPVCYTIFFVAHMNFPPIYFQSIIELKRSIALSYSSTKRYMKLDPIEVFEKANIRRKHEWKPKKIFQFPFLWGLMSTLLSKCVQYGSHNSRNVFCFFKLFFFTLPVASFLRWVR